MNKILLFLLISTTQLIVPCSGLGQMVDPSNGSSRPNELCGGLQLKVTIDSTIIDNRFMTASVELISDSSLDLSARYLSTKDHKTRMTFRIFDGVTGGLSRGRRELGYWELKELDIDLDSITDGIPLGIFRYNPFMESLPESEFLWGQIDLFIPPGADGYWSGVLMSEPFKLPVRPIEIEMEEFSFVVPTELILGSGPRLTFDSSCVETITVMSRRGFTHTGETRAGGMLASSIITPKSGSDILMTLPFLPYLELMTPIRGTGKYIDGVSAMELTVNVHESKQQPEFYHGVNFEDPHRLLWERTYRVSFTRDEILALTPDVEEKVDYRTCLMPSRVRLENDRTLTFRDYDVIVQEYAIPKGYDIGYSVMVNKKNAGCFKGIPKSPLTKLRKLPTCDSPVEISFRLFTFNPDWFKEKDDNLCGTDQTLWYSKCIMERDTGTYELIPKEDFIPLHRPQKRYIWKQFRMPKNLVWMDNGRIGFDSTDMYDIQFQLYPSYLPIVQITVENNPPELVSTQLANPLVLRYPPTRIDTTVAITMEFISVLEQDNTGLSMNNPIWSETYILTPPLTMSQSHERGDQ